MLSNPKIMIRRNVVVNKLNKISRFCSPLNRKKEKIPAIFAINYQDKKYPTLEIYSERQMAEFIYNTFGEGEYIVLAFAKGIRGFWTFWRGEIDKEGYLAKQQRYNRNEIDQMEREMMKAETEEEKELIKQEIEEFTEIEKEDKKTKRYGFNNIIKSSGTRGVFHLWTDPDEAFIKKQSVQRMPRNINWDTVSIDDMNNF